VILRFLEIAGQFLNPILGLGFRVTRAAVEGEGMLGGGPLESALLSLILDHKRLGA
jgi:hypothetical protein